MNGKSAPYPVNEFGLVFNLMTRYNSNINYFASAFSVNISPKVWGKVLIW